MASPTRADPVGPGGWQAAWRGLVASSREIAAAGSDLFLGSTCPGCEAPGRGLCPACRHTLATGRVGPRLRASIGVPLWAANPYEGVVAELVSAVKDRRRWEAVPALGARLALVVAGLVDSVGGDRPVVLVPIPSTPSAVRTRGLDVVGAVVGAAGGRLHRVGLAVAVEPRLVHTRAVRDQSRLGSDARWTNLHGALRAKPAELRQAAGVVVVDDLVTTGATLAEGIRALRVAGHDVMGAAAVAATGK